MKVTTAPLSVRACLVFRLFALFLLLCSPSSRAQNVQHLTVPLAGGLPGMPVMTGIERSSNRWTLTWDGPAGYYQLFQKQGLNGTWQAVGARTNLTRRATVTTASSNMLFKVLGPAPHYGGSGLCTECHQEIHDTAANTPHAHAFQVLQQLHQDRNSSCLPCHTVGNRISTGFVSQTATPQLAGVQCENCHGPAANHAANPDDPTVRARVEPASTLCGGCHTSTFNQWKTSEHAEVIEDLNAPNLIGSCGRCHSGSVRLSLLNGDPLPVGDANVGIVCATCHNPHQTTRNPAQLRNPLTSTNDYFITTSGYFTNQYKPNINLCAQCHNHRGATWTDSTRPPHPSAQYNLLLGSVGELASGPSHFQPATHALSITNQCVGCHMQTVAAQDAFHPPLPGHTFRVETYDVCLGCHSRPQGLVQFTMGAVSNQVHDVKALLDLWAVTKAPASLQVKYGTRAWEYSTPGALSSGGPGPTASEQTLIPVNIQKARFNMYLVLNEGSLGVHNGPFTITLLETAETWVETELNR